MTSLSGKEWMNGPNGFLSEFAWGAPVPAFHLPRFQIHPITFKFSPQFSHARLLQRKTKMGYKITNAFISQISNSVARPRTGREPSKP
jgi:hypothetical protein